MKTFCYALTARPRCGDGEKNEVIENAFNRRPKTGHPEGFGQV